MIEMPIKVCTAALIGILVVCFCVLIALEANEPSEAKYIFHNMYEWQCPTKAILVESGVKDVEDCLMWAFGEGYNLLLLNELDDKWRELHSDLFEIAGHDCIIESTKKIGRAWLGKD